MRKQEDGEIKNFTGIDSPYETPQNPDIVLDSNNKSVSECATQIFQYMLQKNLF